MRNKLAFYDSAGSMQAVMLSRYLYNVATTSRGVYAGFSNCRPRYCRIFMCFLCFWGLQKIFSSEIPLFLFSGVFLKLFLYRPLPRIEKQVTLDFWYLTTNFFRIDPALRNSQVIPSNLFFTSINANIQMLKNSQIKMLSQYNTDSTFRR